MELAIDNQPTSRPTQRTLQLDNINVKEELNQDGARKTAVREPLAKGDWWYQTTIAALVDRAPGQRHLATLTTRAQAWLAAVDDQEMTAARSFQTVVRLLGFTDET
jgi:hypothetical protein